MSTEITKQQAQVTTVKSLFNTPAVKAKFEEILGGKSAAFMTSVLQIANQNDMLAKAEPTSILNCALMAATLDLPLNNNLGYAYIIPYNQKFQDNEGKWQQKQVAQFQIGAKGFLQLALRSSQFLVINSEDVREGEIKTRDRLSGKIEFDWIQEDSERIKKPVIGYVSYFKLLNGYEHTFYMSVDKLKEHGKKYSKTFDNANGLWIKDFDGMCRKTVIKLNLSKNAPLSVEMQKAITADQAVITNTETIDTDYVDVKEGVNDIDPDGIQMLFENKKSFLTPSEIKDAERILKNHETNSYSKLKTFLESKEAK